MTMLIVDGIRIDTTIWIDAHVAKFKDSSIPWAFRRHELVKEIADYQVVLRNFGTTIPHDVPERGTHEGLSYGAGTSQDKALMNEVAVG